MKRWRVPFDDGDAEHAERLVERLIVPHPSEELVLYLPPARREEER
jgi:hypothetical protein